MICKADVISNGDLPAEMTALSPPRLQGQYFYLTALIQMVFPQMPIEEPT
jgi:hypothetical protein